MVEKLPKDYWLLDTGRYEMLLEKELAAFKKILMGQWKKGASKRGDINLFTDERVFGVMPPGSEGYGEFADLFNYCVIIGPEQQRRKDHLIK